MSENRHWSSERCELAKAYPGKKWSQKVLQMSDAQVHAAWISVRKKLEKTGRFGKSEKTLEKTGTDG